MLKVISILLLVDFVRCDSFSGSRIDFCTPWDALIVKLHAGGVEST